ncbi:CDP-alcohol phosphatidyltransferase family protein [bacterium]|nr:CDP-alcohol phosphatidyltransferase family protein [bacterium]
MRRHAANLLSLSRVVLAPVFAAAALAAEQGASGWIAAAVFALVIASDAVDGRLARRFGTSSDAGRALDHGADIIFLLTAFAAYVWIGALSWWVPAAVGVAFALYVVDWRRPSARGPRWGADRIGHLGGVGNWVLLGVLIGNHTVGLGWLPPPVMRLLFALVLLYSAAAIAGRLAARR